MVYATDYTYLDYNATAPLLPVVQDTMCAALREYGNPSSVHCFGQKQRYHLNDARGRFAEHIGCLPEYIIFTSGGTEANNLALKGVSWDKVFMSPTEHDSVYKASAAPVHMLDVNDEGILDLENLEKVLCRSQKKEEKVLVSVIAANNETGVLQPLPEIVKIVHACGGYVHVDGVQLVGKHPCHFSQLDLDLLTCSAHKFGGPKGVGALVVHERVPLVSLLQGGGQEKGRRSGTENIPAILGMVCALENVPPLEHLSVWHRQLEKNVLTFSDHKSYIFGEKAPRLSNTSALTMPGVKASTQVMHFDLHKIAISSGSACSSGRMQASRVYSALDTQGEHAPYTIRISSGWASTQKDFDHFEQVWKKIFEQFHNKGECDVRS